MPPGRAATWGVSRAPPRFDSSTRSSCRRQSSGAPRDCTSRNETSRPVAFDTWAMSSTSREHLTGVVSGLAVGHDLEQSTAALDDGASEPG